MSRKHHPASLPLRQSAGLENQALNTSIDPHIPNLNRFLASIPALEQKGNEAAMAAASKIEWTEHTWNPVTGCTKISAGCKNCYAEALAKRLQRMGANGYSNGFRLTLHPNRLADPLARKKPTIWFVNSMSDLFHERVPFDFIDQVLTTICLTPQHRYQILTKRAERMAEYFETRAAPQNVWLGTSVENRKQGVPRIPILRGIRASVRFLSIEPLLEDLGELDLRRISWVIVGGESGPKARPMQAAWARSIRDQCELADVPFFFKQWGSHGADGVRRAKSANGRKLDGRIYNHMPAS
jgi:protein gp37